MGSWQRMFGEIYGPVNKVKGLLAVSGHLNEEMSEFSTEVLRHSMGGNLALNYAIRHRPALAGVVVSAAYLRLAFNPPALKVRMAELKKAVNRGR